jgi:hypothetical protein
MGGKSTTSTQSVSIPPEVLARYNAVNTRAEGVAGTPFQQYSTDPSAFVAPLTQQQQAGIQSINQVAGAAQPFYQQQMQAKFDKENGETKAAGIDAANKMNEAKSLIAEFDKLDADPKTDKQSASYLEAQRKAATAKTEYDANEPKWSAAINKLKGLQEEFNLELSKQGMSQLKKSKGGLIFKKGGSLSVSDRKELKEHEFALKERLESAKQRAKEANERYKELKKQELEFRKSLTKSSMEGYKIIDNFYKKYKK